jgi:hypothetical protein
LAIEFYDLGSGNAIVSTTHSFSAGDAFFTYRQSSGSFHTVSGNVSINSVNSSDQKISASFDYSVNENTSGNSISVSGGKINDMNYSVKYY